MIVLDASGSQDRLRVSRGVRRDGVARCLGRAEVAGPFGASPDPRCDRVHGVGGIRSRTALEVRKFADRCDAIRELERISCSPLSPTRIDGDQSIPACGHRRGHAERRWHRGRDVRARRHRHLGDPWRCWSHPKGARHGSPQRDPGALSEDGLPIRPLRRGIARHAHMGSSTYPSVSAIRRPLRTAARAAFSSAIRNTDIVEELAPGKSDIVLYKR